MVPSAIPLRRAPASKEQTKILESRKNLLFIHFFEPEMPTGFDMLKPRHQGVEFSSVTGLRSEPLQPLPKRCVKSLALRAGNQTGFLDQVGIGAESNSFHTISLYANFVVNVPENEAESPGSTGDSGTNADDGHEAAARSTFLAVAEEKIAAAGGAEIADEDVWGAEASTEELATIGFAEIEQNIFGWRLVAGGHHVEPLDGIGFIAGAEFVEPFGRIGKLRLKLGGDFGADFVAAAADGGADGSEEIGGLGLELHVHLADGFDDDALERAAPAGVNGGDGTLFRIDEENRDAIGGLDAQEEAGTVGGGGIAGARFGRRGVEKMDDVGMDLFQRDELEVRCAEGGLEAAAVLEDVFCAIPFGKTEIENFFAVQEADAAGAGAEAVDKPGEFCECRCL